MDDPGSFERRLTAVVADGGDDAPRRICELCVVALPVDGAAITVMSDGDHQEPVWASDEVAARLDELQFTLGQGPCVEAFTSRRPVLIADITADTDPRWPMFATAASRDTRARAVYVLPLQAGEVHVGVIDFYRARPGMLGSAELASAARAADAAFWSLLGLRRGRGLHEDGTPESIPPEQEQADPHGWLAGAPLEHAHVYQATGMVIAQLGVGPDLALTRLRAHAFLHDMTLKDVAREVIARRLRFTAEGGEQR